jgi:hypothetical protein
MAPKTDVMERLAAADPLPDAPPLGPEQQREADALLAQLLAAPVENGAGSRPHPRLARRPRLVALAATALLAFLLLSAPGRDATAWVGDLVGIGEVGGSPTGQKRGFEDKGAPGSAVVIDNGEAPDGTRYEWVAFRCEVDLEAEGLAPNLRGYGLSLEWPTLSKRAGDGSCAGPRGKNEKVPVIGSYGTQIVPSQFEGVAQPDLVVSGTVNAQHAARVRVVYRDMRGERHDLPVDFARVGDELHARAGRGAPRATFTAFIPGSDAARDRVVDCLDIRAAATVAGHHPFERCAEVYPEVRDYRARLAKCRADVPPVDRAGAERMRRCTGEPPPGPVEVIVYDADGKELGRQEERMVIPAPKPPVPAGKPEYRGQGPGKRSARPSHGGPGKAVVLLSGRTPDGAPYEYYTSKTGSGDKVTGLCMTRWYPYAGAGAGGFCGKGFPPTKAYGKAWPAKVEARSFGFLERGEPATAYYSLQGFARPNVERVRVVYKDGARRKRDAPVKFVQVRGALRERVGSKEPFGFFAAFLPPSVMRYYDGPGDRASGEPAIEIVSYDKQGAEIGRFGHRN